MEENKLNWGGLKGTDSLYWKDWYNVSFTDTFSSGITQVATNSIDFGEKHKKIVDNEQEAGAIIIKCKLLNFFLHGSRDRFKDYDILSPRDWDFAISQEEYKENNEWFLTEFIQSIPDIYYADKQLVRLLTHKDFPTITVQVKKDLALYIRTWNKVPTWYWKCYLWKSNPINSNLTPEEWKVWKNRAIDTWNMFYEVCRPTEMADWR